MKFPELTQNADGSWTASEPSSQGVRHYVVRRLEDGRFMAFCYEVAERMYGGVFRGQAIPVEPTRFDDPHEGYGDSPEDALVGLFINHGWYSGS